jgi:hypothetical protein
MLPSKILAIFISPFFCQFFLIIFSFGKLLKIASVERVDFFIKNITYRSVEP